jgi:drug/metabolite transporter (DMT)-like permease
MIVGTFLLTSHDAISKWMTSSFTVGEVLIYRSLVPALFLLALLLHSGGAPALRPRAPRANFTRAILGAATSYLVVTAYSMIPLADALAIIFASPIFVTALSVPLLAERVGWRRWTAVVVGFVGVLVMVEPSGDFVRIGALIAVAAALASALRDVVTRGMGSGDTPTNIIFYTTLATGFAGVASLTFGTSGLPTLTEFAIMSAAGLLATVAQWLLVKALQLSEASFVIPLRYLAIVYGAMYGFLVFGEVPGVAQFLGAVIVVGSGIFIVRRQRQ